MEPFSIWLLTNVALLDRWQKQSQMLQDQTISWLKWPNRVTVLTLPYKKKEIQQIYFKKNWDNGQWKRHTEWVPGISWSTHLSTLWVLCILPWVRGRGGWTVWIKHTVIPQLSVHGFLQCIWTAVPNSVPTEILFHSLYTKTVQLNLSTRDSQTHWN